MFNDKEYNLKDLAITYKDSFVLKIAYDIRGDGVTIGKSVTQDEWRDLIEKNWNKPFILQEFIEPPTTSIFKSQDHSEQMKFSLDFFMFNGKFQGFGSKVSNSDKLNIFKGGSKLAIFSEC